MPCETESLWPRSVYWSRSSLCCAPGRRPRQSSPQTHPNPVAPQPPTSQQTADRPSRPTSNLVRNRHSRNRRGRGPHAGPQRTRVSRRSATVRRAHRIRIKGRPAGHPLHSLNRRGRGPHAGGRWIGGLRLGLPTSDPSSGVLRAREGPPNRMPSVPVRRRSTGVPYRVRNPSGRRRRRHHPTPGEARILAGREARRHTAGRRALRTGGSNTREEPVRQNLSGVARTEATRKDTVRPPPARSPRGMMPAALILDRSRPTGVP